MSKLTYNLGFTLGTVIREFLYAVKKANALAVAQHQSTRQRTLPPPCVPDNVIREMDQLPAIVRVNAIDLDFWYLTNTRICDSKPTESRTQANVHALSQTIH
ncbi:UNVERIFIED_ORG: hypothetical protein EDF86_1777 [Pseudomonas psychrophila]